jgi:hypothetical protein
MRGGTKKLQREAGRSGSKACGTCLEPHPLVEHHINGRKVKNWDKPWNISWICATCHDKVHLPKGKPYRIVLEGWYETTSGRRLVWHKEGEPSLTGSDAKCPTYAEEKEPDPVAPVTPVAPLTPKKTEQKAEEGLLARYRRLKKENGGSA